MNHSIVRMIIGMALLVTAGAATAVPEIQHWTTSNGVPVVFVEAHQLPIADVKLVFDAGSARDGDQPGLSRLTHKLLDEGSGDWDANQIAARFEDVGAEYSVSTGRDRTSISLRSLVEPELLKPALATYIQVVAHPSFPERAFGRAQRQTLVKLQAQAQEPGSIAKKAFYKAVYGDHPFAHPVIGTPESVKAIGRDDVKRFHRRHLVAANATLALVGDMDTAKAKQLAERITRELPAGRHAAPLPAVKPLKKGKTINIAYPSEQAHVFIGEPGVERGGKGYFPLYVGNHVLGGSGFTSRLVKQVRVQRGLSYSVYSYFLPKQVKGPFLLGLQTRGDQTQQAIDVAKHTVRRFIAHGPDKQELKASKQNITGGFPLRIDSNQNILDYLAVIGYYGLPLDYLNTFNDRVSAVSTTEIQQAFKQHLEVDNMVTVIVGGEAQG